MKSKNQPVNTDVSIVTYGTQVAGVNITGIALK